MTTPAEEAASGLTQRLASYVNRVRGMVERVRGNEAATRRALVEPLFECLGWDTSDPTQFIPEYKADFGTGRSAKPMDYVIFFADQPVIVVEVKEAGKKLVGFDEQLADYFAKLPTAHLAILTNGVQWRFFSDLERENIMDPEPFLVWDVGGDTEMPLELLESMRKPGFVPDAPFRFALRMRNRGRILAVLQEVLAPSPAFLRLVAWPMEDRRLTENVLDEWRPQVAAMLSEWARQQVLGRQSSRVVATRLNSDIVAQLQSAGRTPASVPRRSADMAQAHVELAEPVPVESAPLLLPPPESPPETRPTAIVASRDPAHLTAFQIALIAELRRVLGDSRPISELRTADGSWIGVSATGDGFVKIGERMALRLPIDEVYARVPARLGPFSDDGNGWVEFSAPEDGRLGPLRSALQQAFDGAGSVA